jgi:hypothetical protein
MSASRVAGRVTVQAPTSQLIEIQATSPRAREAQALSQAVAEAYVRTIANSARSATAATIDELNSREERLNRQILALQDQIDATTRRRKEVDGPGSPADVRDSQLLAQLTVDQADASLKWEQVKKDLSTGAVASFATPAAIVEPGTPATGPGKLSRLLTSAAEGAVLFAVLTAIGLLVKARRDPRLHTRDDLADAVGSTVLADVRSRPQRSVAEWSALFQTYDPAAVDAWAFRQVLRALAASSDHPGASRTTAKRQPGRVEHPRSVTIVSLAGDRRALAVAPQLASFAASLGISTRFVAAAGQTGAASLWAACGSAHALSSRAGLVLEARSKDRDPGEDERVLTPLPKTFHEVLEGLLVGSPGEGENDQGFDDGATGPRFADEFDEDVDEDVDVPSGDEARLALQAVAGRDPEAFPEEVVPDSAEWVAPKHIRAELTVVLAVADRRTPTLRGLPDTAVTVLAISPGFANREELARLAVAVDDAGGRIDGIVIADPDPADATTGRRTLDERALETPLPVRMTGVSQLPLTGGDHGKSR